MKEIRIDNAPAAPPNKPGETVFVPDNIVQELRGIEISNQARRIIEKLNRRVRTPDHTTYRRIVNI